MYRHEFEENTLWGGNDPPLPSRAQIILAAYKLQEMSIEEKLERKTRLDAVFQAIQDKWEAKKCTSQT